MLARIARIRAQGADRNERQFADAFGAIGFPLVNSSPGAIVVSIVQAEPNIDVRLVCRRGAGG
jgi:hypothetical protein